MIQYVLVGLITLVIILQIMVIVRKDNSSADKVIKEVRDELGTQLKNTRDEVGNQLKNTREEINSVLGSRVEGLTKMNEAKLENIRTVVEQKLEALQKDNSEKLEKMRATVDDKLNETLEKSLGEKFKLVNDRLESVYKGLGEMQNLANGVGDLKKVLTNVKARGTWGEVQLGTILEQFLTPEQYEKNVKIKKRSQDFVEFAIKIPSKVDQEYIMLPIDSKFPIEDYQRLVDAEDRGNIDEINECRKNLARSVKVCAGQIRDKYIDPPYTTDFGVMFLPTESLYCEVLRNTSLCEELQTKYKVTVTGPTTFSAFINSLQMGFRTLAIEKQTSEVWQILGNVKAEFGKFGVLLDKTNKKLAEISSTMRTASMKTKTIERKLNKVQALPVSSEESFYGLDYLPLTDGFDDGDQTDS